MSPEAARTPLYSTISRWPAEPRGSAATAYYDVEHISELDGVLDSIGATVILSCHLHLDEPPPDHNLVNVYLDSQRVDLRLRRRLEMDRRHRRRRGSGRSGRRERRK